VSNRSSYLYLQQKKEKVAANNETEDKKASAPPVEVRVMRDGPLVVRGEFKAIGADGKEMRKMKIVSYCRCGNQIICLIAMEPIRKVGWSSE
jgi:hypothetical protein